MKTIQSILGFFGAFILLIGFFVADGLYEQYEYQKVVNVDLTAEETPAPTPVPAPLYPIPGAILPIVDRLGMSREKVAEVRIIAPANASECGDANTATAEACYDSGDDLLIMPLTSLNQSVADVNATFAHEYLHHVWFTMPALERMRLMPYLEQAYQNTKYYLDDRMVGYDFSVHPADRMTELHSFIGTEISDSAIPAPLLAHYAKYVPNRNALPSYN
jgi:hypothetical protein